ncbi:carbonic anhydrase 7-like [Anopheles bellator]|uniref:carbonic anhydrase 7-like n=1 Tax=Anopheles bellator TaxID=139047 RepID=UPI002648790E|nr:carbonic anhydrase 7-like [Anopheles bellator]
MLFSYKADCAENTSVQSPIRLTQNNAFLVDDAAPLLFLGHGNLRAGASLTNNGQSAVLKLNQEHQSPRPFIIGGPLGGVYVFEQLHFHWGPSDRSGSEHVLNESGHSMEVHVVHYNVRYSKFEEAVGAPDGLVVVAVFLQAFKCPEAYCAAFQPIVDGVHLIRELNGSVELEADCLRWLTHLDLSRRYYTYRGSLTTPPFATNVTWIVYEVPISVAPFQTAPFRRLQRVRGDRQSMILKNYRPLQPCLGATNVTFVRNTCQSLSRAKL